MLFCQFKTDEFNQLCNLLCTVFDLNRSEIAKFYQDICSTHDAPDWPSHKVRRGIFQSSNPTFQETYNKSPVIAIDLPSCFELDDKKSDKPTIIVIAQDAKSDQDSQEVRLGTPFALHSKGCREILSVTRYYYEMVNVLVQIGYRVYLTDIFKVWVCDPNRPYNRAKLPTSDQERFFQVLEQEIPIMNPSIVVTWGRDASLAMHNIECNIRHLAFPHPGGAAGGAWARLLDASPTRANKLAYWETTISEALNH